METTDHMFVNYCFSKQVWHVILATLGMHNTLPTITMEFMDWWLQVRWGQNKLKQKGLDSMVMLVTWCLWKEMNGRIFDSRSMNTVSQLIDLIFTEVQLWVQARAKWLGALGWLESLSCLA